jgi:hypothetical protein
MKLNVMNIMEDPEYVQVLWDWAKNHFHVKNLAIDLSKTSSDSMNFTNEKIFNRITNMEWIDAYGECMVEPMSFVIIYRHYLQYCKNKLCKSSNL